jgi:uncharacterized protein (TIGR03382 family)
VTAHILTGTTLIEMGVGLAMILGVVGALMVSRRRRPDTSDGR